MTVTVMQKSVCLFVFDTYIASNSMGLALHANQDDEYMHIVLMYV